MKLLVTLAGSNDGPEIQIARHSDTLAETDHVLFSKILDLVEPAIYEALRQGIREGLYQQAVCYWNGTKFTLRKG